MDGDGVFWVTIIGGLASLGAWMWYYAALGKRTSQEELEAGRDLTYEINPFTGSAKPYKKKE
ncbi:hypothetical protein ERJ70_16975 [Sediminibacillus dalangtanensis]|uniref:Sporulation protein YhaL n=1 Tax=Sediminibacillus dalangtanensis TaxID=2729421 RepID=A0ABX7VXQ6_9BACI|nr:hypothetical protein [Sediminibacillus dalangtanensis]QTN00825.1 hypothetical protein ERJ70_16975 [Sediminibacillus dalangtanensis]